MTINNIEFDVDFTDADFIERIDKGNEEVQKRSKELEKMDLTPAEGIRQECKIAKDFLDYVLGEGTSEKLFGEKNSLNLCVKALEDIEKARREQEIDFNNRVEKYSPDRLKR